MTTTAIASIGKWEEILPNWGLEITGKRHITCPLCKKSKKIRINEIGDTCAYICTCSSGSAFSLIMDMTGQSFAEIAKEIDLIIGNTPDKKPKPQKKVKGSMRQILDNMTNFSGTETEIYLKKRGIINLPTMSINHCISAPLYNSDGVKQSNNSAMIATVTDSLSLEKLQLHITYLDKNSNKIVKKVQNIKDTDYMSPVVRLMDAGKTLGISEGIENALSASDLYDIPCWSTINAGFMKRFRAPLGVTELFIFADNDKTGTGHAVAFECARANLSANNDVSKITVVWPEKVGEDFNEIECKDDICTWSFDK